VFAGSPASLNTTRLRIGRIYAREDLLHRVPSPYEVLGLDSEASTADVHRAYRRRVKEAHPDHGGSAEEFRAVREAYEALTSDETALDGDESPTPDADPSECRVEYLDYEVIDDRGWDVDDPDLFSRAAAADLDPSVNGRFLAPMDESLLTSAQACGFAWPYACCGGACANCAILLIEGELEMPSNHILPESMLDRGIRLSCNAVPATPELRIVHNVKTMPGLAELKLPADRFERAYSGD
jgi:ferredoxin